MRAWCQTPKPTEIPPKSTEGIGNYSDNDMVQTSRFRFPKLDRQFSPSNFNSIALTPTPLSTRSNILHHVESAPDIQPFIHDITVSYDS